MIDRAVLALGLLALAVPTEANGIPAFARRYRTSCSTCHTAAPKLNALGEAFRLNGYRMPVNEQLLRREETVALGEEPWRDLWPRAIWPGDIPAAVPISLRLQFDAYVARAGGVQPASDLELPHELYLLAGTTLGDGIGVFAEATLSPEDGAEIAQAKVVFADVAPFLPSRLLNLWVGRMDLHPFTFASRQIDRAGRETFRWQTYRPAGLVLRTAAGGTLAPRNGQPLIAPQAAIAAQGLIGRRVAYTAGLSQGGATGGRDDNGHKDLFYTVRWKVGGLALDGTYRTGEGPVLGGRGPLFEHALVIEHFAYWGAEPADGQTSDAWRAAGLSARVYAGRLDIGAGYVERRDARPFGATAAGAVVARSVFGKAEVAVLPWLFGSLKVERFDADVPAAVRAAYPLGRFGETRVLPGAYALVRQNVRAVLEAELFTRHQASADAGQPSPATLRARLDLAF